MAGCFETYSSADVRTSFLNDKRGKLIKSDSLYINLYDYWTCFHASNSIVLFTWYHPKMALLEKNIRKKWETMKDFPFVTVFKKIREKDKYFNPKQYLRGDEKYYEILQQWKIDHEKKYLEQFPHLSRAPICHKKMFSKSSRASLRYFFNYF